MRTVLVTAASGTAGRHIVEALLDKGFGVVGTSRNPAKLSIPAEVTTAMLGPDEAEYNPVEIRTYDADDAHPDFEKLFQGIDMAVLVGTPLDGRVHEKLAAFIDAAAQKKIEHLVYLSGNYLSGMTGKTLENLPIRKIEQLVIRSGLKHTLVRASFFMDNYTTGFYSPMVEKGVISLATGHGKTSLVAASDVGAFIAASLTDGLTGEYLVTGPEALDHFEVADLLTRSYGKTVVYKPLSEDELVTLYKARNLSAESTDYGLTLYRAFRNQTTAAVTDGFKQATGREPINMRQFLGIA